MTINCKGQLIDLSTPKVMGILNITPDSFYDGGSNSSDKDLLNKAEKMLTDGATFLDVGGYSSRPGADDISVETELKRILSAIEKLLKNFPEALISIDTFRSKVAEEAVKAGAVMVNDISAGKLDEEMLKTVSDLNVPYVMMHMRGTPQNMKQKTDYQDIIKDIVFYFSERIEKANTHKIKDIIIDPGFGFAKTLEQNYQLLKHLEHFLILERPILIGVSRKSMVYKPLNSNAKNSLNGTTILNTVALQKGAHIIRVHDVKEAMECIKLNAMLN